MGLGQSEPEIADSGTISQRGSQQSLLPIPALREDGDVLLLSCEIRGKAS
jgi:hypothetical protein